ncbi:hypothetical protein ACOMHN_016733 [Nucella lapillus]
MASKDQSCEGPHGDDLRDADQAPTPLVTRETKRDLDEKLDEIMTSPSVDGDDTGPPNTEEVEEEEVEKVSEKKPDDDTPVASTNDSLNSKEVEEQKAESNETCKQTEATEEPDDGFRDLLGNGQLKKKVLRKGKLHLRPSDRSVVRARVKMCLEDGTCVQDDLQTFVIGEGDVIQAIDMIVALMEEYEIVAIIASPRFGYGSYGRDPDIPPDATLNLEVELVEVLPPHDLSTMPAEDLLHYGEKKRAHGNLMFKREEYSMAISAYSRALKYFEAREKGTKADAALLQQIADCELTCYNNMAACQLKIGAFDATIRSCNIVLRSQPGNVKALYRMGKALSGRGDTEKAIETLKKAIKLEPQTKMLHRELSIWTQKLKREMDSEKNMYKKMMGTMADAASQAKNSSADKSMMKMSLVVGGIMAAVFSVGFAYYRTAH